MLEEQLKKIIIERYGSVMQFSKKIDVPYTTIDTILKRGIDNSNVSNVIKICKELKLSVEDMVDNKKIAPILEFDNGEIVDISSNMIKIPVYGTIKAGIPIESQTDITEYVEIPKEWTKGGKSFYGIKISGDSMYPKYDEGDIVIFEYIQDFETANGKDCAIMINGSESTFKKVLLNEQGIVLQPYNLGLYDVMMYSNKQIENLPIKVVGVAREKRTRLN